MSAAERHDANTRSTDRAPRTCLAGTAIFAGGTLLASRAGLGYVLPRRRVNGRRPWAVAALAGFPINLAPPSLQPIDQLAQELPIGSTRRYRDEHGPVQRHAAGRVAPSGRSSTAIRRSWWRATRPRPRRDAEAVSGAIPDNYVVTATMPPARPDSHRSWVATLAVAGVKCPAGVAIVPAVGAIGTSGVAQRWRR